MAEAIAPADAEAVAVAWLRARFAERSETATVATKVPPVRPARMVRISLVDTIEATLAHFYARLIFECSAPTETAAERLAARSFALMRAIEGETAADQWVGDVLTVSGPSNNPDEVGPCYQFTLDLLLNGEVI